MDHAQAYVGGGETSGRTVAIAVGPVAVEVNELETGLLKALDDERRNAFDHLVPEHGVIFHPRPQTGAVDGEGLHKLDRVGVEAPLVRGKKPGQAQDLAWPQRLDQDVPLARRMGREGHFSVLQQVEGGGGRSLGQDDLAGVESNVVRVK